MTRSWIITYVIIIFCLSSGEDLFAQSALDPNCYEPTVGNGIDTYMKSSTKGFGTGVILYPQPPANDPTAYYISFIDSVSPYNYSVYRSPRPFELHGFTQYENLPFNLSYNAIFGHFHSTKVLDLLFSHGELWTIYWADDNGNFDTSRYTKLQSTIRGDYNYQLGGGFNVNMPPYVAKMTNDSLDDILLLGFTNYKILTDTSQMYVIHYTGGDSLYHSGSIALNDSVAHWGPTFDSRGFIVDDRYPTEADFRGVGRTDWLASDDHGNMFYFKNDAPFSLQRFVDASHNDTLLAAWQNPNLSPGDGTERGTSRLTMRALPRQPGDSSMDFMPTFYTNNNYLTGSFWIFRGGKDFASKRFLIDTTVQTTGNFQQAEFVLRSPALYDGSFTGMDQSPAAYVCGDMTGTGKPVVKTGGAFDHGEGFDFYYVLGDAIDDKVDIILAYPVGNTGNIVSVDADGDPYQDELFEADCCYEGSSLNPDSTGLWVLHGSPKIPVHLNPKYSVTTQNALDTSVSHILTYPNPFDEHTVLTFENCSGAPMIMQVTNATGAICLNEEIPAVDGLQAYGADLSKLSAGMYFIRLECPSAHWSGTVSVVKTGGVSGM